MSDSSLVLETIDAQGIATLTLNRPEVHNALNEKMIEILLAKFVTLEHDPCVKVLILKANGRNFSAGADLKWMERQSHFSETENFQDAMQLAELFNRLYHFRKPTIALAHGASIGGGIGLLACCDLVIASKDSTFCFSEVKLGLIPAVISPYIIATMGVRAVQRYFLTAATFDTETAQRFNLVSEIVEAEQLLITGQQFAEKMLAYNLETLSLAKSLIHEVTHSPINPTLIATTARYIAAARSSPAGREGMRRFLAKNTK